MHALDKPSDKTIIRRGRQRVRCKVREVVWPCSIGIPGCHQRRAMYLRGTIEAAECETVTHRNGQLAFEIDTASHARARRREIDSSLPNDWRKWNDTMLVRAINSPEDMGKYHMCWAGVMRHGSTDLGRIAACAAGPLEMPGSHITSPNIPDSWESVSQAGTRGQQSTCDRMIGPMEYQVMP